MQTWPTDALFEEYLKFTSHRMHGRRTWIHGVSERQAPLVDHALRNGGTVLFVEQERERFEFAMKHYPGAAFRNASLQTAMTAVDEGKELAPDNLFLFDPDAPSWRERRLLTLGLMEYFRVRRTWVVAEFPVGYRAGDFDPQIWNTATGPSNSALLVGSRLMPKRK